MTVLLFLALAILGPYAVERSELPIRWVELLRQRYFVFSKEPLLQSYVYMFIHTFVLKSILLLLLILYLSLRRLPAGASLGLNRPAPPQWRIFTLGTVAASLALAAFFGTDPLIPNLPTALFFSESAVLGNTLSVLSVLIIAPVTEEIFFRGFLYPGLRRFWGPEAAILATSLLFMAAHYAPGRSDPAMLAIIFAVGLAITTARAVTGSTSYAVFLHALYNLIILAAGWVHFEIYGY